MKLSTKVKTEILAHAKQENPKECCGLVVIIKGRQRYFPCKNIAETPDEHFVISPEDYALAEEQGEVVAVAHSHPITSPQPSPADQASCNNTKLPWFIVNPNLEEWGVAIPNDKKMPYIGREFVFGVVDCYTLVRDWYKEELNIELDNFYRRDRFWERGENLYMDNYASQGFRKVDQEDVEYGDLVIMQLQANLPNHGAIYIGDQQILQHVQGRLSSRDVYGGYYAKITAAVLRHESR